ncbi:PAF1 (YBR279W) [Zygosaccharomyces parabailii]|nr:PAF1 (YBR279W) [Zygosaccharomyces parabailii]CDH12530.1 related to RNA polymerase II-associated protein 1 [Zygosaccharomyces bailii ISA1307]
MSKKQDYIAKIRYENRLPAPLLAPKLLKYNFNPEEEADSPELITSLYTKTSVTPLIKLNDDLGMPLDLMKIPGMLDHMDTKYLYDFEGIKLQPEDRMLLRDPGVDKLPKTDISKVSFLRRTEYISTAITSHGHSQIDENKKRAASELEDEEEMLSAPQVLQKVENTFDSMTNDLSKLQHPVKKRLRAVKTWNLLPDTASMDQNYFLLKMVGSALLDEKEKGNLSLSTAIFRPVELEEDEWISMYTTDPNDSEILNKELDKKLEESLQKDKNEDKVYKFKRLRDFDLKQVPPQGHSGPFGELSIVLNDEKSVAYYKPLRSKIELRRRRVNDVIKPLVREHNLDQLNVSLRNPTTQEAKVRDKLRMQFDPIDFAAVDEEEEQVDSSGLRASESHEPQKQQILGESEGTDRSAETIELQKIDGAEKGEVEHESEKLQEKAQSGKSENSRPAGSESTILGSKEQAQAIQDGQPTDEGEESKESETPNLENDKKDEER